MFLFVAGWLFPVLGHAAPLVIKLEVVKEITPSQLAQLAGVSQEQLETWNPQIKGYPHLVIGDRLQLFLEVSPAESDKRLKLLVEGQGVRIVEQEQPSPENLLDQLAQLRSQLERLSQELVQEKGARKADKNRLELLEKSNQELSNLVNNLQKEAQEVRAFMNRNYDTITQVIKLLTCFALILVLVAVWFVVNLKMVKKSILRQHSTPPQAPEPLSVEVEIPNLPDYPGVYIFSPAIAENLAGESGYQTPDGSVYVKARDAKRSIRGWFKRTNDQLTVENMIQNGWLVKKS